MMLEAFGGVGCCEAHLNDDGDENRSRQEEISSADCDLSFTTVFLRSRYEIDLHRQTRRAKHVLTVAPTMD